MTLATAHNAMRQRPTSMADHALRLAALGLRVFPVRARDKRPATPNGCKDGTTDPSAIREMFGDGSRNIGVACGGASGVIVVDIDGDVGAQTLRAWEIAHGPIPRTPTARTARGVHLYFAYPEQAQIKNSASKIAPGIDVRTDGGYVVAPPSVHPDGSVYVWVAGLSPHEAPPAPLPEWLCQLLTSRPTPRTQEAAPERSTEGHTRYGQSALDAECRELAHHPEGGRNDKLNAVAFRVGQLVASGHLGEVAALADVRRAALECGLGERETEQTIASGFAAGERSPNPRDPDPDEWRRKQEARAARARPGVRDVDCHGGDTNTELPEGVDCFTDLGNAHSLVQLHGADLRHCDALGWRAWDGVRWTADEAEPVRRAMDAARQRMVQAMAMASEARTKDEQQDADAHFAWARKSQGEVQIRHALDLARRLLPIATRTDAWDADPWLFNCTNGTIDLRTGVLREHRRDDLITRIAPVAFDPAAKCPVFERFLAEVQPDPEVRAYLARLFGYALTGTVREHVLGVFWGPGGNGKSALADVVTHALGDYAKPGPSSLIVSSGGHEPHPTDVASCHGSRLVIVHETKRGANFDASKVKVITGGDKLTARRMREDFFTFAPTHKLIMLSNYKPAADGSDAALWRRVQLVPFNVTIPEERRDPTLADKIRAEAPGVLAWLVRGCMEWQRIGLAPPAIVREQTESYRASEDSIAAFIEERCVRLAGTKVQASVLYAAYRTWCDAQGSRPTRSNDFGSEIEARGFRRVKLAAGRFYEGIGLHTDDDDDRRAGS